MIPLNIILAFLLSFPINPLASPYGCHIIVSGATQIVPVLIVAKIVNYFLCIHVKLLAWIYRNNHHTLFKIFVYLLLHFDEPFFTGLSTQWLLNACMWHALDKDNETLLLFLLQCEANPNIVYKSMTKGIIPYPDIYKLIGNDGNCYPSEGLLAQACQKNNTKIAIILLQHHADPDCNNVKYYTDNYSDASLSYRVSHIEDCKNPLIIACHNNNTELVKQLIRHNTKTHPFVDTMLMQLENTNKIPTMNNLSSILKDKMTEISKETYVSAISFTLCHQNHVLFNMLALYTLEKNGDLPASFRFMQFVLFGEEINSPLLSLPKEIKQIIGSNIFYQIVNKNNIEKCFVRDKHLWAKHSDHKIRAYTDHNYQKYLKNKITAIGFYSSPKLTIDQCKI